MACTAWETYVEDRVQEAVQQRLGEGNDSFQNRFVLRHLQTALKQFNNPNTEKTCKLFSDHLGVDVSAGWQWNNYDSARIRLELDALIKKRGEAVHRSKAPNAAVPAAHLIRKDELEKSHQVLEKPCRSDGGSYEGLTSQYQLTGSADTHAVTQQALS